MAQETVEIIKKAEAEADGIIAQAEAEAKKIIAEAEEKAKDLKRDAETRAEQYRNEALEKLSGDAAKQGSDAEAEAKSLCDGIAATADSKRQNAVLKCAECIVK